MLERSFVETVISAKQKPEAMIQLLEILAPLIKSYAKKLFFLEQEDARQEIIIAIIEAVKSISRCENDGQCLAYINNAVKFKFAHMCKKNIKKETIESINEIDLSQVVSYEKYEDIEMEYDMQVKRQSMTKNQKAILDYILLGYSDREISEELGISRQYINRIKKDIDYNII